MKYKELTTQSEAEVKKLLEDLRGQSHDLSVKIRLGQIKTTHKLRQVKKDIARVMLYLSRQKE